MNAIYVVKQTIDYPDGMRSEGYLQSVSFAVFTTGQIENAKKYKTKTDAKKDIVSARSGQRRRNAFYEILRTE